MTRQPMITLKEDLPGDAAFRPVVPPGQEWCEPCYLDGRNPVWLDEDIRAVGEYGCTHGGEPR